MGVFVIVPFIGILALIAYAAVREIGPSWHFGKEDSALIILRERYARGELSDEEFRRMRKEMKK